MNHMFMSTGKGRVEGGVSLISHTSQQRFPIVLDRASNITTLRIKEALHVSLAGQHTLLNRDQGSCCRLLETFVETYDWSTKPHLQPCLFPLTKTHTRSSLSHFLFCTALAKTTVCSQNITYNYIAIYIYNYLFIYFYVARNLSIANVMLVWGKENRLWMRRKCDLGFRCSLNEMYWIATWKHKKSELVKVGG